MVIKLHAKGYEETVKLIEKHKANKDGLFVLFSAVSWCPDCVKADPVVEKGLEAANSAAIFIHSDVGERDEWKNQANSFRTDSSLQLKRIPTLIRYGTPKRLEEEDLFDLSNVQMLFED